MTPRAARVLSLQRRLNDNAAVLLAAYRASAAELESGRGVVPAAEWLLDNYHLVEEQIREIRDDLPPGYYRQLPKLADGPFAGYPRVFGLAWAFVAHTDSHFDPDTLRRFVVAYQRVQPLTIGELWAVAITLRIVLVENLRRLADQITAGRARARGRGCAGEPAARRRARALRARRRHRHALAGALVRAASRRSSPSGCATRIPRPRRRSAGWRSGCARRARPIDEVVQHAHQRQGASNVTRAQRHHQHAADVRHRLGRAVREREPGRRTRCARRSDFAAMDFADAQPLPQRHRAAGARFARSPSSRSPIMRWMLRAGGARRRTMRRRPSAWAIPATT